jgi:hypothetical protein
MGGKLRPAIDNTSLPQDVHLTYLPSSHPIVINNPTIFESLN